MTATAEVATVKKVDANTLFGPGRLLILMHTLLVNLWKEARSILLLLSLAYCSLRQPRI